MPAGVNAFYGRPVCVHPLANLFPLMSETELDQLTDDIKQHGLREAIVTHDGQILDGRNRYLACQRAGVVPRFREWEGGDLVAFVVSANVHRRHLSTSQKAMVCAAIATMRQGERTDLSSNEGKLSQADAADLLGIGHASIDRARVVTTRGIPALQAAVRANEVSVSAAAMIAQLTPDEQLDAISGGDEATLAAAMHARKRKTALVGRRIDLVRERLVAPPTGKYACIAIDPPWETEKISRDNRPAQHGFDYPTMTEDELRAFHLPSFAADDCHLYVWVTHKHLPSGLRLIEHWGFRYQCVMTWRKNVGFTPFSWMYSTEHVLFCRRGSLPLLRLGMRLDFAADIREHSRKPDTFYDLVREASPGPRIDVFSREQRDGFDQYGNETMKFAL